MTGWLVAVEGPSAAGKTRTVRAASQATGATPLPEAYERLRPRPALTWATEGQLVRLERRLLREECRRYLDARRMTEAGATVLADTGFLGPLTYTLGLARRGLASRSALDALLRTARQASAAGRWGLPDAIVYLRTPLVERRRRAASDPKGHPSALQARHQAIAADEGRVFRTLVAPTFGDRFRYVSAAGPPDAVVRRLVRAVARSHTAAPRPSPDRLLRAIGHSEGVP
jgi:hypothetical protein